MTLRFALALALVLAWLGASGPPAASAQGSGFFAGRPETSAQADPVREPRLEPAAGGGYSLSADFDLPLTPSLVDALARGVPLHFVAEFELQRPRWWWFDAVVVQRSLNWRVAYHALTRQYRVTQGASIQSFDSIEEALRTLARLRDWRVVEEDEVQAGVAYEGQVRLRLDTAQLPKPFQIGGLASRDWNPQSQWKRFEFTVPIPRSAQ